MHEDEPSSALRRPSPSNRCNTLAKERTDEWRSYKRVGSGSVIMIRRFLDCSSGHLSPETWRWLDAILADDMLREPANQAAASIVGGRTRYGWFVYAAEDPDDALPEDLRRVCDWARRQGAEYVLLDCDALPMDDLPVLHPDFTTR